MLEETCILKLGKYILKRFEKNLNDGTIILFDVNTFDVWFGNESSYDLICLIDGSTSLKSIYNQLIPQYTGYSKADVIESFNSVIEELLDKHFLETV